eukprot:11505621-Karenia_brevis.AAC.1
MKTKSQVPASCKSLACPLLKSCVLNWWDCSTPSLARIPLKTCSAFCAVILGNTLAPVGRSLIQLPTTCKGH